MRRIGLTRAGRMGAPTRCQSAGRPLPLAGEESPGSTETRCRITSGGGDPRESATEIEPPAASLQVRVKRCGKSAPRTRQRGRHGKPHREQNRIGTMLSRASGRGACFWALSSGLVARGAQRCASQRNGRHVGGAIPRPSRTRLTGRLAVLLRWPSEQCWLPGSRTCPLAPGSRCRSTDVRSELRSASRARSSGDLQIDVDIALVACE